jgi:chromosome segregation ATPase
MERVLMCGALYSPRYTRNVANELFDALMQFHREVVQPQFDEIREKIDGLPSKLDLEAVRAEMATKVELQALRDDMTTGFEAVRAEMATKSDLQAVERGVQAELQAIRREMVTWPVLIRFHEFVVRPEIDDVRAKLADLATRDETFTQVDGIYVHLGRLEHEYHALTAAVRRLEAEMKQQNANMEVLRAEMFEVRKQILDLGQRVTNLENVLN